jgi:hypothetical protein
MNPPESNELIPLPHVFYDESPYHAWPGLNAYGLKFVELFTGYYIVGRCIFPKLVGWAERSVLFICNTPCVSHFSLLNADSGRGKVS